MMWRISLSLFAFVATIGFARANVIVETVHFPAVSATCWAIGGGANGFTEPCPVGATSYTGTPAGQTGSCGSSSSNYSGTCIVYVSSTGNDSGCTAQVPPITATPTAPCKTISVGVSLLRATSADWLLLKAGDTFANQDFNAICAQSGISATAPLLISSYGSGARPFVEPNNPSKGAAYISTGSCSSDYIAWIGIELYAYTRDPGNAAYNYASAATDVDGLSYEHAVATVMQWALIEDCKISFFSHNINYEPLGGGNTFVDRRNIILSAWSPNAYGYRGSVRAQNMFTDNGTANGAETTYQNLLDSGGWNATLNAPTAVSCSNASPTTCTWGGTLSHMPGADGNVVSFGGTLPTGLISFTLYCTINTNAGAGTFQITPASSNSYNPEGTALCPNGATVNVTSSVSGTTVQWADAGQNEYDRNLYDDNPGTDFEQNFSTRSSSGCFQFRGGAVIKDNVCSDSPSGGNVGNTTCGAAGGYSQPCIVSIINDNTWLSGIDQNTTAYYTINSATNSWGFQIQASSTVATNNITANAVAPSPDWAWDISGGFSSVTLTGNPISAWGTCPAVIDSGSGDTVSGNTCTSGGFSTATIGAYNAQLADCASLAGGCAATTAAFIKSAAARAPGTWPAELAADAVNTYVRNLFGLSP